MVALSASLALAQDRLFLDRREVDVTGHFGAGLGTVPPDVQGRLAGAGRYLVQFSAALDTLTGARVSLPGGWMLEVDPTRPRAFTYDGTHVSVVDLTAVTLTPLTTALHPYPRGFVGASYAPDTDELFLRRRGGDDNSAEIAVVSVSSREVVRVLPNVWEHEWDWHVTGDGQHVVAMTFADFLGGPYVQGVHLIDALTGARLATYARSEVARVVDDRRFGRTYVTGRGGLVALDRQFAPIAFVPLAASCYPAMALSAHTDRLYVVSAEPPSIRSNGRYLLTAYDVAAGRWLATADVTTVVGFLPTGSVCNSPLSVVVTAPPPPRGLAATVTGCDVGLSWQAVGASSFVLDVGLIPGRTDVTLPLGTSNSATIANAPPGTYYVRVRGTNAFGVSRPSNEAIVVVP